MGIRVGAHILLDADGDFPQFLKQYGVDDVLGGFWNHPDYTGDVGAATIDTSQPYWTTAGLIQLRQRCTDAGFRLLGLENPVPPWYYDRIMLGLPGRDRQIEHFITTIRQMGEAGLRILGYHWMANPPGVARASSRTTLGTAGRGGARAESFDIALARALPQFRDRVFTTEEMWANYTYFIRAVVPVAEQAGVRLSLHPDDPPIPEIGGIPRLFHDPAGFQRAMEIAASPASGLNFCLGNWTAMGTDILAAIRHFGGQGLIVHGHVQGVKGVVPNFRECFLDEADCDFPAVFRALAAVGFDGIMIPAHFPRTIHDTPRQHQGHAFGFGYVKALIQASALA